MPWRCVSEVESRQVVMPGVETRINLLRDGAFKHGKVDEIQRGGIHTETLLRVVFDGRFAIWTRLSNCEFDVA